MTLSEDVGQEKTVEGVQELLSLLPVEDCGRAFGEAG